MEELVPLSPLPDDAKKLAWELSNGETLESAAYKAKLDLAECQRWLSHPDWPQMLKGSLPGKDEVTATMDTQVRPALDLYRSIIRGVAPPGEPTMSLALRLRAAGDMLDRRGYGKVEQVEVKHFIVPQDKSPVVEATIVEMEQIGDKTNGNEG